MQVAAEAGRVVAVAVFLAGDGSPGCVLARGDIATQEELQVAAAGYVAAQGRMTLEGAVSRCFVARRFDGSDAALLVGVECGNVEHTQVVEVLQQIEFALCLVRLADAVVDVDLAGAVHVGMIYIQVVQRVLHYSI